MEKHNQSILYKLNAEHASHLSRLVADFYLLPHGDEKELLTRYIAKGFYQSSPIGTTPELDAAFQDFEEKILAGEEDPIRDFRIKHMTVNNFRRFPSIDTPCGLSFSGKSPKSLILIGGNGEGKSSLYAALEYVFCGTISEAKLRDYDVKHFASHSKQAATDRAINIEIQTNGEGSFCDYQLFKDRGYPFDASTFFCSEWDIFVIGHSKSSDPDNFEPEYAFHDFFVESLGFGELLNLNKVLRQMIGKVPANSELESRREDCQKEIKALTDLLKKESERLSQFKNLNASIAEKVLIYQKLFNKIGVKLRRIRRDNKDLDQTKWVIADDAPDELKWEALEYFHKMAKNFYPFMDELLERYDLYERAIERLDCDDEAVAVRDRFFLLRDALLEMSITKSSEDGHMLEVADWVLKRDPELPYFNKPSTLFSKINLVEFFVQTLQLSKDICSQLDALLKKEKVVFAAADFDELVRLKIDLRDKNAELDLLNNQIQKIDNEKLLQKELADYCGQLSSYLNREVRNMFESIREPIIKIMKHFLSFRLDKEDIRICMKDDKISVQIEYDEYEGHLNEGDKKPRLSPQKYYNTFRYKLFCMVLKISVALMIMKRQRINFPIILDDVFYASDYNNRELIALFLKELLDSFKKVFPDNERAELQLICFTHDELVLDAICAGAGVNDQADDFIFGRLIDYKVLLADENEKAKQLIKAEGKEYYNLYIELFK